MNQDSENKSYRGLSPQLPKIEEDAVIAPLSLDELPENDSQQEDYEEYEMQQDALFEEFDENPIPEYDQEEVEYEQEVELEHNVREVEFRISRPDNFENSHYMNGSGGSNGVDANGFYHDISPQQQKGIFGTRLDPEKFLNTPQIEENPIQISKSTLIVAGFLIVIMIFNIFLFFGGDGEKKEEGGEFRIIKQSDTEVNRGKVEIKDLFDADRNLNNIEPATAPVETAPTENVVFEVEMPQIELPEAAPEPVQTEIVEVAPAEPAPIKTEVQDRRAISERDLLDLIKGY